MANQLVGYARVSSVGQSLDVQAHLLHHASCSKIAKSNLGEALLAVISFAIAWIMFATETPS